MRLATHMSAQHHNQALLSAPTSTLTQPAMLSTTNSVCLHHHRFTENLRNRVDGLIKAISGHNIFSLLSDYVDNNFDCIYHIILLLYLLQLQTCRDIL